MKAALLAFVLLFLSAVAAGAVEYWNGANTSNWYDAQWASSTGGPFTSAWVEGSQASFIKSSGGPYASRLTAALR